MNVCLPRWSPEVERPLHRIAKTMSRFAPIYLAQGRARTESAKLYSSNLRIVGMCAQGSLWRDLHSDPEQTVGLLKAAVARNRPRRESRRSISSSAILA
jgi:hypothetical protein